MLQAYPGRELDLFSQATNWKAYWASLVGPYVKGAVLEVGAGIGSNTTLLNRNGALRWVCVEPDVQLCEQLRKHVDSHQIRKNLEVVGGTIDALSPRERFDTVLYLDVLEHVNEDAKELDRAVQYLRPGGTLIVLVPAHQFLYSDFDKSIGHFRRYTRKHLLALAPPGLQLERAVYLDAVGIAASLVNRMFLKQHTPTERQIEFWDRNMVPLSRSVDRLFLNKVGKSLLVVWRRQ